MRFLKEPIFFIVSTMFLNFAGLTIIIPVIPYIVNEYSVYVALFVGAITSLASLCQFLVAPALGYISDIVGRRPVILLSLLGGVVGYVLFGIGGSLAVLFIARIIDGLSSGDTTAMYAYVADIYEPKVRTKYYGYLGAAAALGFMIGPALGGLAGQISLSMPLYLAAALSFLNVCWGYFVLPESLKKESHPQQFSLRHLNPFAQIRFALNTFTLRALFAASFIFFLGLIMQQSNFSVFLKEILSWGPIQIGIVLSLVGLVDFFAEGYLVGAFTPVFGEIRVINIGIVLTALGMLLVALVAFTHSPELLYFAVVMYTLGDGLFEPAMLGLIAAATEPHAHGRIQGANQSIQALARVIAPLLAGVLYEAGAYLPYVSSAVFLCVALFVVRASRKRLRFIQAR